MTNGVVRDVPNLILRAEGLALFAVATVAYAEVGASWGLFALLILAPDLFMLGYLRNPRLGAMLYNLGHTTVVPFALIGLGLVLAHQAMLAVGLIWLAHVGMDRMAGYGLKYSDAFKHTHLSALSGAQ